jgi:hypothetical protein
LLSNQDKSPFSAVTCPASRDLGEVRCVDPDVSRQLSELRESAMRSEYDFEDVLQEKEDEAAWPEPAEELVDRFGIRTALVALCVALFIAAIWLASRPSFEKCSALENATERNACFETLRNDLLKPPAKGADIPRS